MNRLMMIALPLIFGAAVAVAAVDSAPAGTVCKNGTGTSNGYFYTFFRDTGTGCITLGDSGNYSTAWSLGASGNLVTGKGWATGSTARVVGYNAGAFDPGGNGYLTFYGWSTNPLVEYYVVDNWGNFTPPGEGAIALGTVETDGGIYRIYRTRRVNQPSIKGRTTFDQYWSVRTSKRALRTNNIITFGNHVGAWRTVGLKLGTMDYQVLATEGFGSNGNSNITVWQQN